MSVPTRRLLFNVLAAVSLALCIASGVLWATVGHEKETLALVRIEHPETDVAGFYVRLIVALTPYWIVVILTALLPIVWLVQYISEHAERRRKFRRKSNLCVTCEYDLTGNVSGTCPECGTAMTAKRARS